MSKGASWARSSAAINPSTPKIRDKNSYRPVHPPIAILPIAIFLRHYTFYSSVHQSWSPGYPTTAWRLVKVCSFNKATKSSFLCRSIGREAHKVSKEAGQRGFSSHGRARPSQGRGKGIDTLNLHSFLLFVILPFCFNFHFFSFFFTSLHRSVCYASIISL